MPVNSIFVARGTAAAAAVPIWFVTAATYPDVRERLEAEALAFADAPATLPHYTTDQLEDQLKMIKSWDDYQDMLAHRDF